MRSRAYLVRLVAAAGVLLITGGLFIPVDFRQEVRIRAATYEVARQLTDTLRWLQWCTSLSRTGGTTLRLQYISPLSVAATLNSPGGAARYDISVCSPLNDTATIVCSRRRISLWRRLYAKLAPAGPDANPLPDLKHFMEHIPLRYGYDLQLAPVRDTLILTAAAVLPRGKADTAVPRLYRELLQFIRGARLPADTGFYYRTFINAGDSIRVAVGIPVHRHDKDSAGIRTLRLPKGGKLLTAHYEGAYDGKEKVYKAMESYMQDHRLRPVAQPYERYPAAGTLSRQGQGIAIDLYYPVY